MSTAYLRSIGKELCNVQLIATFCLSTAAAPGEKSMGSSENLIPGLDAFPGKAVLKSSQY